MLALFKQNKQFRILLMYQVFSGLGGGVFSLFMLLSVHLIYQNPIYTGIAGFLMTAPHVFALAVGPVVDRRNKVSIMRITTLLEFAVLALLVAVPFQDSLGVGFMFAVILIYAMAALFEAPAGTALLPQIVEEDEIMQANSLMQIASLAGGIIIAVFLFGVLGAENMENFRLIYGMSAVFLALAFIFGLFLKNPDATQEAKAKPNYWDDLKGGFNFLRQTVLLFILIMIVARAFFAEIAYINMPMFAETHVGAQGYVLITVMGLIGGILASSLVSAFGDKIKVGQLIFLMSLLGGLARIAFALTLPNSYIGGLAIVIVYSTLLNAYGIIIRSLIQKIPPKDMVGRIDTLTTTFAAISITIGALAGGFIGSIIPVVDYIFIFHGVTIAIIGSLTLLVPSMRALPRMNDIKTDDAKEMTTAKEQDNA